MRNKNAVTWFDLEFEVKPGNKINEALLRLFDLMKESLHIYFNIENSSDIHDFLKIAAVKKNVDHSFVEWIREKGVPRLNNIDFKEPEEVRGCIISMVNCFQENINICTT